MVVQRQATVHPPPDGPSTFLSIATYLPLRRWRDVPAFLSLTSRVEAQLKQSAAVLRYGLRADLLRRRFWTYSVWSDRDAVGAFVREEPHATAVKRFGDWAGAGAAFVEWESGEAQIDWADALERLKTPTFYYKP